MHTDTATDLFLPLERRDLIRFEQRLRRLVGVFLPHEACSLYFPGDTEDRQPEYLPDEERLLLPLYAPLPEASRLLGIFVARGVTSEDYEALKTRLPQVAEAAMENLFAYKAALCDSVTGLLTRRNFVSRLALEVNGVRDSLRPASTSLAKGAADPEMPAASSGAHPFLATLVIRLHGLRQVVSKHGYTVADDILSLAGQSLRDVCPEQGTTARIGDYEFAVLMPAATAKTCRRLAGVILETFSNIGIPHELTRSRISVTASVGYALYPQDITGNVLMKPSQEQAQILLRKARLAAALAAERLLPVLAFGRILAEGGRVTSLLPLSRFGVSFGSSVNAREGQRFSVYSSGGGKTGAPGQEVGAYKGEVVLVEVKENSSVAEIIHQADPSVSLAEGDALVLLPGEVWGAARTPGNKKSGTGTPDPATNLLRHGDFLAAWSGEREKCDVFSLGLLRIAPHLVHEGAHEGEEDENAEQAPPMPPDTLLAEAVRIFEDVFGRGIVGGRYGLTSLMAFHPGVSPEELLPKYQEVCALVSSRLFPGVSGPVAAAGLAGYPYLDCRKADVLENCNKALEYAILLPSPHVGAFDSLAMTISADKRFSSGDFLGAMTEYKQALLADGSNALAWNSLGVTLARLGRHDEARGHFDKAIALEPEAMTLYNMGYSCQCLGEKSDAKRYYEDCLAIDGTHMYALVRLGQLAENDGDFAAAREWYGKAGEAPGGRSVTCRYLAGLSLKEDKKDEAREHLHEALSLDPQNAAALQMLAEIYLDGGEDAEVAESLARQSVVLSPARKAGWLVLSRALERSGRYRDAREALMRAGAL